MRCDRTGLCILARRGKKKRRGAGSMVNVGNISNLPEKRADLDIILPSSLFDGWGTARAPDEKLAGSPFNITQLSNKCSGGTVSSIVWVKDEG